MTVKGVGFVDNKVEIIEVGPRDGFQSVTCAHIPLQEKLELIGDLVDRKSTRLNSSHN